MNKSIIALLYVVLSLLANSCRSRPSEAPHALEQIYTAHQQKDTFVVKFRHKGDTAFLSYCFIFGNGDYLNCPLDSSDYAGFLVGSKVSRGRVTLPIKDYRQYWNDPSKIYNVTLTFLPDSSMIWNIDTAKYGILDFLPMRIIFKRES